MEFKGTKGEWTVDIFRAIGEFEPAYMNIGGENYAKVCKVWNREAHRNDQNQNYETSLANAKLIAAAPETIQRLQKTNEHLKALIDRECISDPVMERCINASIQQNEKAIEKALK